MEESEIILEDGLLQPIPEEKEAELDKILDAEDIDQLTNLKQMNDEKCIYTANYTIISSLQQ